MYTDEIYAWEDGELPKLLPLSDTKITGYEILEWTGKVCALWRLPLPVVRFSTKDSSSLCYFEENLIQYSMRRPVPIREVIHEVCHLVAFQETYETSDGQHSPLFIGSFFESLSKLFHSPIQNMEVSLKRLFPNVALQYPKRRPKLDIPAQVAAVEALKAATVYRKFTS